MIKKISISLLLISGLLITSGLVLFNHDLSDYQEAKRAIYKIEKKDVISRYEVSQIEEKTNKLSKEYKKELIGKVQDIKNYYNTNYRVNAYFKNDIVISETTIDDLKATKEQYNKLNKKYKKRIKPRLNLLEKQLSNINSIKSKIDNLYTGNTVKEGVKSEIIYEYEKELNDLPQKDIVNKYQAKLNNIKAVLDERHKAEIEAAWVKLNVPYISQNLNGVYNGCEAAALMMGIQYKGLIPNMNYLEFVKRMPLSKTNNAFEGFTHDIYGLEPRTIPHWIAPAPLAKFGRDVSGYSNIVDGTGLSIDELDKELEKNNPVVIYATGNFKEPQEVIEGVPKNIHVMLLSGYNRITKEQFITDPWTNRKTGQKTWVISKNLLESRHTALGKKSVVIK